MERSLDPLGDQSFGDSAKHEVGRNEQHEQDDKRDEQSASDHPIFGRTSSS